MAYIGYFKTEKNPGAKWNGWLWLQTYINMTPIRTIRQLSTGSIVYMRTWTSVQNVYCHSETPTEPVTDGQILTSVFDDAEIEYNGPAGYIYSFTSETGFITANQDLSVQPAWIAYFTAKNLNVSSGYTGHFSLEIYKRNSSNNDTLLFSSTYVGVPGVYPAAGLTMSLTPTGTIITTDRLRIRIYMYEAIPS